jgi:hypothetical protein
MLNLFETFVGKGIFLCCEKKQLRVCVQQQNSEFYNILVLKEHLHDKSMSNNPIGGYTVGWVDIGTRTKVPLMFVTYLSNVIK